MFVIVQCDISEFVLKYRFENDPNPTIFFFKEDLVGIKSHIFNTFYGMNESDDDLYEILRKYPLINFKYSHKMNFQLINIDSLDLYSVITKDLMDELKIKLRDFNINKILCS